MEKPKNIPDLPGVYYYLDIKGKIIYVGKAKSLKKRVASYFSGVNTIKTVAMLEVAKDLKFIVTKNELEAFLLECNLIKTEKPKYNILLKDSKAYPYVKLTKEEYPRLLFSRNTSDRGAIYFGPFVESSYLKDIMRALELAFPLRSCSDIEMRKARACMKYQINRCCAPCESLITKENYDKLVAEIKEFFSGKVEKMELMLADKELAASKRMDFEAADFYKTRLEGIKNLFYKQGMVRANDHADTDVFYYEHIDGFDTVTVVFIRLGNVTGVKTHLFTGEGDGVLERFIYEMYNNIMQFPEGVSIEGAIVSDDIGVMISAMAGRNIAIRKRGFSDIIKFAKVNAQMGVKDHIKRLEKKSSTLEELSIAIGLEKINYIDCIDISHLGGTDTVGVSVCWGGSDFAKSRYRKYRMKMAQNDDFASIYELITRKIANIKDGSEEQADLYIIDGGIGQLNAAMNAAKENNFNANFIAISKGRSIKGDKHNSSGYSIESIHIPGNDIPLTLMRNSNILLFTQLIRDEAHRFAITYQRSLRSKTNFTSKFASIEGMGKVRIKELMKSIPDIVLRKSISPDEIHEKSGIPMNLCVKIAQLVEDSKRDEIRIEHNLKDT